MNQIIEVEQEAARIEENSRTEARELVAKARQEAAAILEKGRAEGEAQRAEILKSARQELEIGKGQEEAVESALNSRAALNKNWIRQFNLFWEGLWTQVAVVRMNKITILGLGKERTRLMESLMAAGVVQISESTVDEDTPGIAAPKNQSDLARLDSMLSEVSASLDTLRRYVPAKKPLFSARRVISREEFQSVLASSDAVMETVKKINACESRSTALKPGKRHVSFLRHLMYGWILIFH